MLGSDLWVHVRGVGGGGLVFKIVFKIEDINTFLLLIFVLIFFCFVLEWHSIFIFDLGLRTWPSMSAIKS